MFNVVYVDDNTQTIKTYLGADVETREEAQRWADKFNEQYYMKPYPNGKGYYPFGEAWVINWDSGRLVMNPAKMVQQ